MERIGGFCRSVTARLRRLRQRVQPGPGQAQWREVDSLPASAPSDPCYETRSDAPGASFGDGARGEQPDHQDDPGRGR